MPSGTAWPRSRTRWPRRRAEGRIAVRAAEAESRPTIVSTVKETAMRDLRGEASRWIEERRDELVATLQRLVETPSVVGAEGACQRLVADLLQGHCDQLDVWEPDAAWLEAHPAYFQRGVDFRHRPNVVGVLRGTGGGRSLIVNAHVDVVDPGPANAWTHPAWS